MYSNTKKRKRRATHQHRQQEIAENSSKYQNLYVQAFEADIQHGARAHSLARSLEFNEGAEIGSALIQWELGSEFTHEGNERDDDEDTIISLGAQSTSARDTSHGRKREGQTKGVWLDRYDARLLLDSLSSPSTERSNPLSRSVDSEGWSDLPSDTEDTFLFSPSRIIEYRNEKRRKMFDSMWEERVKGRVQEDEDDDVIQVGKGRDEDEPNESQLNLMQRTANHLLASPNPALLEMRILANHGADERFAFLKGTRWKTSWDEIKKAVKGERERELREKEEKQRSEGLRMLSGYQSESESGEGSNEDERETTEWQGK